MSFWKGVRGGRIARWGGGGEGGGGQHRRTPVGVKSFFNIVISYY